MEVQSRAEQSRAELTGTPSGKHRQKKLGRGRPTPSLIASVRTPVMSTENRMPAQPQQAHVRKLQHSGQPPQLELQSAEEQLKQGS
jgi:hypothetical protein